MEKTVKALTIIIAIIAGLLVSREIRRPEPLSDAVYHDFDSIEFPYVADKKRVERIKANSHKLQPRLWDVQVSEFLGKPDKAGRIYKAILSKKVVGKSYVYVLSQDQKEGSQRDKNRVAVVVYFDNEGRVTTAYGPNIDFSNNLKQK